MSTEERVMGRKLWSNCLLVAKQNCFANYSVLKSLEKSCQPLDYELADKKSRPVSLLLFSETIFVSRQQGSKI